MPWVGLQCVIMVFPDHTHLFFGLLTELFLVVSFLSPLVFSFVYSYICSLIVYKMPLEYAAQPKLGWDKRMNTRAESMHIPDKRGDWNECLDLILKVTLENIGQQLIKVSKGAKIRNRYNQVPHLSGNQWESDKLTVRHHIIHMNYDPVQG